MLVLARERRADLPRAVRRRGRRLAARVRTLLPSGELKDPIIQPERVYDWAAGLRARGAWGDGDARRLLDGIPRTRSSTTARSTTTATRSPVTRQDRTTPASRARSRRSRARLEFRGAVQWSSDKLRRVQRIRRLDDVRRLHGQPHCGLPGASGRLAVAYTKGRGAARARHEHERAASTSTTRRTTGSDPAARRTRRATSRDDRAVDDDRCRDRVEGAGLPRLQDTEFAVRGDNFSTAATRRPATSTSRRRHTRDAGVDSGRDAQHLCVAARVVLGVSRLRAARGCP